MKNILTTLLITVAIAVYGHPGIGLVYDGDEYIYYTDLKSVWRVSISSGEKFEVLPGIHTHELFMDSLGSLYGEHYWYEESQQKFYNYIWRMKTDGTFEKIIEDREGENEDFSFVRDRNMNGYLFSTGGNNATKIFKQTTRGDSLLLINEFEDVRWKYLSPKGELFFVDLDRLYKYSDELKLIASDLISREPPFLFTSKKHSVYGIWQTPSNELFVAVLSGRVIKKITEDKEIKKVYKTPLFWTPVNGVFDKSGDLWLMEANLINNVRVRNLKKEELSSYNYSRDIIDYIYYFTFLALIISSIRILIRWINKSRERKVEGT